MTEVYNVGNRVVNAWLFRLHGKTVLVDTGYAGGYPAFAARCRAKGIPPETIDYILLTHAHDDHAGFLQEVLAASGARVLLHEAALPTLRNGQNAFIARQATAASRPTQPPVKAF